MSEMLTDLLQNIYSRISQLGRSIQDLQKSIDSLNSNLIERVDSLVGSINSMTQSVEQEGETQHLIFQQIGDSVITEISKFREKLGLKDLDELLARLNQITDTSAEALQPETVDLLLKEVLEGIKSLKLVEKSTEVNHTSEELLQKVDESLSAPITTGSSSITSESAIPKPKNASLSPQNFAVPPPKSDKEGKNKRKLSPPPGMSPPPT